MKCPVCENDNCTAIRELYDDRYGFKGYFKLVKCLACGHKYLDGEFSPELLTRLYTDFYPRADFKLEDHRPHKEVRGLKSWLDGEKYAAFRWVPKGVRVLDIGCGFGETLGYHKSRGCDAYGVEADQNIVRIAERFGYKVNVGLFDPKLYEPGFFDYVTLDQVIEHTVDPVETLKGVYKVLKPGGVAVLSLPNSNGWSKRVFGGKWLHWHAPYHIQHFTVSSMEKAAEKAGLKIEKYKTVTYSLWLHHQLMHLMTRPPEGERSFYWSSAYAPCKETLLTKIMRLAWVFKIDHVLTRFFDVLRLGDNFVFILSKPS